MFACVNLGVSTQEVLRCVLDEQCVNVKWMHMVLSTHCLDVVGITVK